MIPEVAKGTPIEIWFQGEARIGQKGTLAYVWARRGTRPRAVQDTRYASAYLPHPELVEGRRRLPAARRGRGLNRAGFPGGSNS